MSLVETYADPYSTGFSKVRFPRQKYVRRITQLIAELEDWNRFYSMNTDRTHDVVLRAKLLQRRAQIDELWHELNQARTQLLGAW